MSCCRGAKNVIYERLLFNQRNQKEGERIDNFVSELKRLSLVISGVMSDELRGELLKKKPRSYPANHARLLQNL